MGSSLNLTLAESKNGLALYTKQKQDTVKATVEYVDSDSTTTAKKTEPSKSDGLSKLSLGS